VSRSRLEVAAAVVVLVGLGVVGTQAESAAPRPAPTRAFVLPVTDVQLVCPGLDQGDAATPTTLTVADVGGSSPSVTYRPLTGADAKPQALQPRPTATVTLAGHAPAVLVHVSGAGAADVVADQRAMVSTGRLRGASSAPCLQPADDIWLTGADGRVGRTDTLVLANPGTVAANVTVTAWSGSGRSVPPRLDSFAVEPFSSVALPVADYVPDQALVTFRVHANSGRVAAMVRTNSVVGLNAAGTDWLPPTHAPARDLVVTGFAPGGGHRLLVVTNPGRQDAQVQLQAMTGTRAYTPAGHQQAFVPAGRSALVDLGTTLGGVSAALRLSSDHPVVAAGMSEVSSAGKPFSDLLWQPADAPLSGVAAVPENVAPFGQNVRLWVTAVGGPASIQLTAVGGGRRTLAVPADRTVAFDPVQLLGAAGRGAISLTPLSGSVYVLRGVGATGSHGPLVSAEPLQSLPAPVRLPPAVPDLRAAVR